jgi:hypothetical protein
MRAAYVVTQCIVTDRYVVKAGIVTSQRINTHGFTETTSGIV